MQLKWFLWMWMICFSFYNRYEIAVHFQHEKQTEKEGSQTWDNFGEIVISVEIPIFYYLVSTWHFHVCVISWKFNWFSSLLFELYLIIFLSSLVITWEFSLLLIMIVLNRKYMHSTWGHPTDFHFNESSWNFAISEDQHFKIKAFWFDCVDIATSYR